MAASANPSGNNQQESSRNGNGAAANDGGSAPHENSAVAATQAALRHNPGISVEWTADEQSLLEELLTKYASERNIVRYAKIAMELKDKTVRDVALRCRWMNKKENGKRRKEDHSSTRKNKDKKEKVADPMAKSAPHATNRSSGPPYAQPVISMDSDDGISYKAIGGVTGELLEQNAHALDQISANFAAFKMHENINLFCQARNNILTILNDLNDTPEIMKQMPPLPVKLNEELANSILPRSSLQKNSLS
ncbi:uncharacterized protein LOC131313679 isoform X2 [Rhododendron vialii]|uniref:uncharacterized protein LOC131313679 isoform X2 n=1 Tax=Rhododendron vialii TaxID=182163 RepID=UPI00265DEA6F|nr:uncharacterized protein LOC131313679 isoform X2 [Rhododendron vialii]